MPCVGWKCGGWRWLSFLGAIEVVTAVIGSVFWATGLMEHILEEIVKPSNCTRMCFQTAQASFHDWRLSATILYGISALFATASLFGLLASRLGPQIANMTFCMVKIPITMFICERLLNSEHGPKMYESNRAFLYVVSAWNLSVFICNLNQVVQECTTIMEERDGTRPVEIRPLTNLFAPYCQNCCSCLCGNANGYEVNSNEIRVPIFEDVPDGEDSRQNKSGPHDKMATTEVEINRSPGVDKVLTSADVDKRQSVGDMSENSLSDIENANESARSGGKALNDSAGSRRSEEENASRADKKSRKSRDSSYDSGDSHNGKSPTNRSDRSRDYGSEDGEFRDEEPLVKGRHTYEE